MASLSSAAASAGMPRVRANALSFASPENSSGNETVPDLSSSHWSNTRLIFDSSFALQLGLVRSGSSGTTMSKDIVCEFDKGDEVVC